MLLALRRDRQPTRIVLMRARVVERPLCDACVASPLRALPHRPGGGKLSRSAVPTGRAGEGECKAQHQDPMLLMVVPPGPMRIHQRSPGPQGADAGALGLELCALQVHRATDAGDRTPVCTSCATSPTPERPCPRKHSGLRTLRFVSVVALPRLLYIY